MREIIPLKKDILFKTIIGKITNINLDYDYKINDNLVNGYVVISGSYKMTEASVLEDDFSYKIPFAVSISDKIKKDTIKIEVDDFKYEVKKDVLSTNIDLLFSCENEEEIPVNSTEPIIKEETTEEIKEVIPEEKEEIKTNDLVDKEISSTLKYEDKYYTYKVYIVREGDSVESICKKYNVLYDDIKDYNDLSTLNIGDKIIIPYINE